ncbi:MAG: Crp/Fnr family transcriptional regulator [Clostridia bacterium]|nr:Crp/Fnr family transcriptional regulator [Clostridia bacterium]
MEYSDFYQQFFPFWDNLSQSDKDMFCDNTSTVFFDSRQPVHNNIECTGLFIVKKGRLRLYILSEDGREITLYRLAPGDLCMLAASCVIQSITFDVYIDAELPSECYMISASAFGDISDRNPDVKIYALEKAVERFSDVMWVMQQVVFMSMDRRIAIFLLDEMAASGSNSIAMTQEQLARHLGTAREVVSRLLKHMAADSILEVSRGRINILDKNKLRSIAY